MSRFVKKQFPFCGERRGSSDVHEQVALVRITIHREQRRFPCATSKMHFVALS